MTADHELIDELAEDEDEPITTASGKPTDNEIEQLYSNLSFRVIYQTNNFFLPQLQSLINGKEVLNLRPEYQRRLRWARKKQSELIESLLLNIPIPPVFFYESELARYEVMDGQQRLHAIHEYLENKFKLTGLETLDFLNGKQYHQLPPKVRRGLDRASISAIVLLQETKADEADPFRVRRYVFQRLNTGGEKLNPQELRNSIYRGNFNNMIVELARNDLFCRIFGIPEYTETDESEYYENPDRQKNSLYRKMSDCQIVLRFFALLDDSNIKGSMRSILDSCMESNREISPQDIDRNKKSFVDTLAACNDLFEGEPFALPSKATDKGRISIALFDAIMIGLCRSGETANFPGARGERIRNAIIEEVQGNLTLFTGKANTAQSIKDRIAAIQNIIKANV